MSAPPRKYIMKHLSAILFLLAVLMISGCFRHELRPLELSRSVSAAGRKRNMAQMQVLASSVKKGDLASARLRRCTNEGIDVLYDALWKLALYLPDEEGPALNAELVFREKIRRGRYSGEDVERLFKVFCMTGLFGKASELKREFQDRALPEVPEIIIGDLHKPAGWWVYELSEQGKKARLKMLPNDGQRIVVVVSPGCEFAENAVRMISSDPELGPVFREKGIILTRVFDPSGVEALKRQLSLDAVYIARKSADFPGLALLGISPHFYFLADGEIRSEFAGWSNEDQSEFARSKIYEGFSAIGVKGN